MTKQDKEKWAIIGVVISSIIVSPIVKLLFAKQETEQKEEELRLIKETERMAQQALLEENAKKLDEMMALAHFNEVKRDLEAMKEAEKVDPNSFDNQVKRLTATANRLLEEG